MPHVVFAVPFALSTTLRFVRAMGSVPGVRLSLLSQEPLARMPADLRELCADYERVGDAMDEGQLAGENWYRGGLRAMEDSDFGKARDMFARATDRDGAERSGAPRGVLWREAGWGEQR